MIPNLQFSNYAEYESDSKHVTADNAWLQVETAKVSEDGHSKFSGQHAYFRL